MKLFEMMEGNDKSVDDVKKNHPEIWKFIQTIGAWMSMERQGKVETYDTHGQHMVVMKYQPGASIENTKLILKDKGIPFEEQGAALGSGLTGTIPGTDINFVNSHSGQRTNSVVTWRFGVPHKDEVTEGWDAPLVKLITKLSKAEGMNIDAQQTLYDMIQSNNFSTPITADEVKEYWESYGKYNKKFDEKSASLLDKVTELRAQGVLNDEFYVDEVVDDLIATYGEEANSLSMEQIAKFIQRGEYEYGPL